jgi:hypothetical protein
MRVLLSCVLLILLTACASGEWVKAGGELASEPVLIQCSQQAGARARSEQMSTASAPAPGSPQSGREQTFFNQCMTELGYNYVPIMQGAGR